MKTKRCCTCKKFKTVDCFNEDKSREDGLYIMCNCCKAITNLDYNHSIKGLVSKIYNAQIRSSIKRNHNLPTYTKKQLMDFIINHKDFDRLYFNWEKSNFNTDLKPSINRIDDYSPYSIDNIELVTWKDNKQKEYNNRLQGLNNKHNRSVLQFDLEGNFIKEYYSIMQAERETGVLNAHIGKVCKNKPNYNTAGGYFWKYND